MHEAQHLVDLLIVHGTVITVDAERRVIEDGAVAVDGDRIVGVGPTADLRVRYRARRTLDAHRKAVLPGLIDCHAHAGHGLLKTIGGGDSDAWMEACRIVYTIGSDEDFWYAEARLAALERLKCGTTTGVCLFGGGDSIMRVDDPRYAARHCAAIAEAGTRSFLAVGPSRPPAPRVYRTWHGDRFDEREIGYEAMYATCAEIIETQHGKADGRINICITLPVFQPHHDPGHAQFEDTFRAQARAYGDLARPARPRLHAGRPLRRHAGARARRARASWARTRSCRIRSISRPRTSRHAWPPDTRIVHNPSAIMSIRGRCPVPELIDAGVHGGARVGWHCAGPQLRHVSPHVPVHALSPPAFPRCRRAAAWQGARDGDDRRCARARPRTRHRLARNRQEGRYHSGRSLQAAPDAAQHARLPRHVLCQRRRCLHDDRERPHSHGRSAGHDGRRDRDHGARANRRPTGCSSAPGCSRCSHHPRRSGEPRITDAIRHTQCAAAWRSGGRYCPGGRAHRRGDARRSRAGASALPGRRQRTVAVARTRGKPRSFRQDAVGNAVAPEHGRTHAPRQDRERAARARRFRRAGRRARRRADRALHRPRLVAFSQSRGRGARLGNAARRSDARVARSLSRHRRHSSSSHSLKPAC